MNLSPFIYILKDTQTQSAEEKFLCVREENKTQILNLSGPTLTLSCALTHTELSLRPRVAIAKTLSERRTFISTHLFSSC